MFEEQKDKTRKKMGKKEKSVLVYKSTLQEEINPKLEKLRNDGLEITGGGRFFNVIEDELVGRDLIKNGNIKKRVTFIPLNKIDPRCIEARTWQSPDRYFTSRVQRGSG
jgi:hypothetical protein